MTHPLETVAEALKTCTWITDSNDHDWMKFDEVKVKQALTTLRAYMDAPKPEEALAMLAHVEEKTKFHSDIPPSYFETIRAALEGVEGWRTIDSYAYETFPQVLFAGSITPSATFAVDDPECHKYHHDRSVTALKAEKEALAKVNLKFAGEIEGGGVRVEAD